MLQNLTGWHALVILAIVLLVFGSTKLPALARSVGQSVRILKHEVGDDVTGAGATGTAPGTSPAEAPSVRSAS
ncbi:hypothetical protein GCM10009737_35180 [Nocardioides lentus]|uniref:Sec-independent protein translocase protein TatA n=1 Tax=Nocardioides lentus TaxID=338077 RepID=A0ABP5B715_9ACTN